MRRDALGSDQHAPVRLARDEQRNVLEFTRADGPEVSADAVMEDAIQGLAYPERGHVRMPAQEVDTVRDVADPDVSAAEVHHRVSKRPAALCAQSPL
jgi:hypothetical protein